MKVAVLSAWASREPFAPYFCRHYAWADKILVLVGPAKWEGPDYPGVEIREVAYRDNVFCEFQKRDHLNAVIREIRADWTICADSDEFLFTTYPKGRARANLKPFLGTVADGNVIICDLWDVYRHYRDPDLNPNKSPLFQRRHGDPEIHFLYSKPIVFRPENEESPPQHP